MRWELSLNNFLFLHKFQLAGQVASGERFVRMSGLSCLTCPLCPALQGVCLPQHQPHGQPAHHQPQSPRHEQEDRGESGGDSLLSAWYRRLITRFKVICRSYQLGQKLARLIIIFSVMSEFFFSSPPPWVETVKWSDLPAAVWPCRHRTDVTRAEVNI